MANDQNAHHCCRQSLYESVSAYYFAKTTMVFEYRFGILNLDHWDLFVICFLVLGIYLKPVAPVIQKSAIYLSPAK